MGSNPGATAFYQPSNAPSNLSSSVEEMEARLVDLAKADEPLGVEAIPEEGGMNERQLRRLVMLLGIFASDDTAPQINRVCEATAINSISDKNLLILFTRYCDPQTGQ